MSSVSEMQQRTRLRGELRGDGGRGRLVPGPWSREDRMGGDRGLRPPVSWLALPACPAGDTGCPSAPERNARWADGLTRTVWAPAAEGAGRAEDSQQPPAVEACGARAAGLRGGPSGTSRAFTPIPSELPSSSSVRSSPLPPPPPSPVLVGRGRDPSQRCPSSSPVPLGKATPSPGSPTRVSGATHVPATARRRLLWSPPLEVEGGPKGPGRGRGQWGVETRAQGTHRLISSSAGSCWAAGWPQAGLSCDSVACWRSGRSSHTRPAWPAPHGTDPTDHAGSGGRHPLSCPVPSAAPPGMRRLLSRRTDAV